MNAAGFYVCAVLVVLACAAAVGLRQPRAAAVGALALAVAVGLFLIVSGEYLLAALELVLLLGTLAAVVLMDRSGLFGPRSGVVPLAAWAYGLGVAVVALVVLDGAAIAAGGHWHQGGPLAGLSGVLRQQAPVTAAVLGVAVAVGACVAVVVARVSADEAEQRQRRLARREREERMRRRREDRAAARERRGSARDGEGA